MGKFIEFIGKEFKKEGYILLTDFYINNKQKLKCICPNGHEYFVSWNHWTNGRRCICKYGRHKPSIDFVRHSFSKEGYTLLSTEYIRAHSKLMYICPKGHRHYTTWAIWNNQGSRCPTCFYVNNSGPNNCNWNGGSSFEPYCPEWNDREYKKSILERDNYQCQNPDCWQTSKKLTVHHIDYDKKNCGPLNLITLCNSCNSRANANRKRHTVFYRNILVMRKNSGERL